MSDWNEILKNSDVPAIEAEIKSFETEIGFGLPSDYRNFLLKFNGGKNLLPHLVPSEELGFEWGIEYFSDLSDLRETRKIQEGYFMRQALNIASDGGTGWFFLILDGSEKGAVYFTWKDDVVELSEKEWNSWEVVIPETTVKISDDFDSLVEIIKNHPITED